MTIQDLIQEWDNLTETRKMVAFNLLLGILRETDFEEDLAYDILNLCLDLESDDFFGTEGANL